jgi:aspartyl-tRNA synthetase
MYEKRVGAGTLRREQAGQTITLCGWVQKRRDFGELVFIDLRDRTGVCQVVVDQKVIKDPAVVADAKELRSEYVVAIDGEVVVRAEESRNPKMETGDVEVVARHQRRRGAAAAVPVSRPAPYIAHAQPRAP